MKRAGRAVALAALLQAVGVGCFEPPQVQADAGAVEADAGTLDAGPLDAGPLDAGPLDAGPPSACGGPTFVQLTDGGFFESGEGWARFDDAGFGRGTFRLAFYRGVGGTDLCTRSPSSDVSIWLTLPAAGLDGGRFASCGNGTASSACATAGFFFGDASGGNGFGGSASAVSGTIAPCADGLSGTAHFVFPCGPSGCATTSTFDATFDVAACAPW